MLPDSPVFGPRMRYVGLPDAELVACQRVLIRAATSLVGSARRLEEADLSDAIRGICAAVIMRSLDQVAREMRALSGELVARIDEISQELRS